MRQHYSDPKIDWLARLPAEASLEQFHEYMLSYIVVSYDETTRLINIHVQAFDREYAQRIVSAIIERSQVFVDTLNSASRRSRPSSSRIS